MKPKYLILILTFINMGFFYKGFSTNRTSNTNVSEVSPTRSAIEIRYIVLKDFKQKNSKEITIKGIKYSLYKTKEEAIYSVSNSEIKRDLVVVYVITDKNRETEIVEL